MRIVREYVAATANILVQAYVGASLLLMLLFVEGNRSLSGVATSEIVAIEIVRMLVGSIGLVLAVPVTTALATMVLRPSAHGPRSRRCRAGTTSARSSDEGRVAGMSVAAPHRPGERRVPGLPDEVGAGDLAELSWSMTSWSARSGHGFSGLVVNPL